MRWGATVSSATSEWEFQGQLVSLVNSRVLLTERCVGMGKVLLSFPLKAVNWSNVVYF